MRSIILPHIVSSRCNINLQYLSDSAQCPWHRNSIGIDSNCASIEAHSANCHCNFNCFRKFYRPTFHFDCHSNCRILKRLPCDIDVCWFLFCRSLLSLSKLECLPKYYSHIGPNQHLGLITNIKGSHELIYLKVHKLNDRYIYKL